MSEWNHNEAQDGEADAPPSKSARKRQMLALQAMGESLVNLNDKQLAQIPINDEQLLLAILECRHISSHSARKRHMQFIGKLMRHVDPAPIERALRTMHEARQNNTTAFHHLEKMRDELLAQGTGGVELVMARWPQADRQQLRQLVLQHQREQLRSKPPAASRKLFGYLKELQALYGETD